ncbi:ATP-binding domain-containing protein [Isoptericola cucumis]|uniref:HelD family protein n=1 Tax=Isoptericola cucumis TaxID=1776856 RepID=UPI00320B8B4C
MPQLARPSQAVRQIEIEQEAVRRMHERVDDDTARLRSELDRALRGRSEDTTALYQREARVRMLSRRLHALDTAGHALCFGRIDDADGRALHVGRLGLQDVDGAGDDAGDDAGDGGADDTPLLVDWRADAARPFYAATPVHPMGLRRRRHLTVDGRRVTGVTDELLDGSAPGPEDVVGDGPLHAALTARRTGRMREVVATLQSEQDEIVRSSHRGVLVVEGGPGTGKTVVALHRAAYVLAAFEGMADDGVLVLGPNARFLDYISQVLPSLGENDVVLSTPSALVRGTVAGELAAADPVLSRVAGRADLARVLADAVLARQAPEPAGGDGADGLPGGLVVRVAGDEVRLGPDVIAGARTRAQDAGLSHHGGRAVFLEEVAEAVVDAVQADARATLERIDAEVAELTGQDLDASAAAGLRSLGLEPLAGTDALDELDPDALRDDLLDGGVLDRAVDALWPRLEPGQVVTDALRRAAAPGVLPGSTDDERAVLAGAAAGPWTTAHLPLLDEAAELLDGPPPRTFGHVVVDEAQEVTPMQWRAVLRRCPSRSLTVVGDLAQAGPTTEGAAWADVVGPDLWRRAQVRTLTVSYRTTAEILAVARPVLARIAPEQPPSVAVRRGDEPRHVAADRAELAGVVVREVAAAGAEVPGGLVGVLAADGAVPALEDALGVGGAAGAASGRAGVRVVPVAQARGLEFDAVVVADPDGIVAARSCGERDLYVALTRATTTLTVVGAR